MSFILLLLVFFLLYTLLIWKAGKAYPILYLFIFVYFIQYIFSTYLIYNVYSELDGYMTIKQSEYFGYAIRCLLFLSLGVVLFNKDFDLRLAIKNIDGQQAEKLGYFLLTISFLFDFISVSGLSSLTRYLKYSGAFCILFSTARYRILIITLVYLYLLWEALASGIFIDFFVLSTYLFFFLTLKFKTSFLMRASFILVAAPVLILVQTVKKEYREATWTGNKEVGIGLFRDLAAQNIKKDADKSFYESEGVVRTVGRLTQGWHLGLVLYWVPRYQPYSDGEEISGDLIGSFIPRLLYQDKKKVGAQEKFVRFTGHKLTEGTSMTIGVLGDFYVNFGVTGSYIALFLFGMFISIFLNYFIKNYVFKDPINIIWIPYFFNYLMRANNDFYMVFNALVKGFIIFLFINYIRKKFWQQKPRRMVIPKSL